MKEQFPDGPDDVDAELLASLDFETENPRLRVDVSLATAAVVAEYMQDRKIGLAHAVRDLLALAMFIDHNVHHLEWTYPNGERDYIPPDLDPMLLEVKRIDVHIDPMVRTGFKYMCEERGLGEEAMLEKLMDDARRIRILHKKGIVFGLPQADGRMQELRLFGEDNN